MKANNNNNNNNNNKNRQINFARGNFTPKYLVSSKYHRTLMNKSLKDKFDLPICKIFDPHFFFQINLTAFRKKHVSLNNIFV